MISPDEDFNFVFKVHAYKDDGDTDLGDIDMQLFGHAPLQPPMTGGFRLSQKCGSFEMTVDDDNRVLLFTMRMMPGAAGYWAELYDWSSEDVMGYLFTSDEVWQAEPGDLIYFEFRSGYDYWHELVIDHAAVSANCEPVDPPKSVLYPIAPPCPYGVTHLVPKGEIPATKSQLAEATESVLEEADSESRRRVALYASQMNSARMVGWSYKSATEAKKLVGSSGNLLQSVLIVARVRNQLFQWELPSGVNPTALDYPYAVQRHTSSGAYFSQLQLVNGWLALTGFGEVFNAIESTVTLTPGSGTAMVAMSDTTHSISYAPNAQSLFSRTSTTPEASGDRYAVFAKQYVNA